MAILKYEWNIKINGTQIPDYAKPHDIEPYPVVFSDETDLDNNPLDGTLFPSICFKWRDIDYDTYRFWLNYTGENNGSVEVANITVPFPGALPKGINGYAYHRTFQNGKLWKIRLLQGTTRIWGVRPRRAVFHEGGAEVWIRRLGGAGN